MKSKMKKLVSILCAATMMGSLLTAMPTSAATWTNYSGVQTVTNSNGLVLAVHESSGVNFLYRDSLFFKDLNKNGVLDPYEDWRLDIETRTADLLSQMPLSQKLALMAHNGNVSGGFRMAVQRSIGKGSQADGSNGNANQIAAEKTAFGIPYAYSSDPVHTGFQDTGTTNPDDGGGVPIDPVVTTVSLWPNTLGLANTFSPEVHYQFGQTISKEYRNSQIFQQLGPLFDQLTHPTWSRSGAAVTEDYDLLIDLAQAEVAGMQTTEESIPGYGLPEGWGKDSISAMAKHVLGTGTGEFGYEGHTVMGGWLVYPGGGYQKYIETITEAAGIGVFPAHSSKVANAAMTAYGIDTGDDGMGRHNGFLGDKRYSLVGGAYSNWIMNEWLRGEKDWDGMITSDWGCYGTGGSNHGMTTTQGMSSTAQRYLVSFVSGMSQTGGTGSVADFTTAYNLGISGDPARGIPAYGQEYMDALIDARAGNAIKTIMKVGLFENPYSDPDKADAENGSAELNKIALQAHHDSIVMLKNSNNVLPLSMNSNQKVYAVGSYVSGGDGTGYGSIAHDYRDVATVASRYFDKWENDEVVEKYTVDDPADADVAIVMISGPNNSNGTSNTPQTAVWGPYTKTVGREVSIGGYWYHADGTAVRAYEIPDPTKGDTKRNMSNIGYTTAGSTNTNHMVNILKILTDTKAAMGDKPVILFLNYRNAVCPAEVEPYADAILAGAWSTEEAFMNLATGVYEPTGLSALTFPRSMDLIEMSAEDVPDTVPYVDSDGNVYQFGFGLNYSGRIVDERTEKYLGLSEIKAFSAEKDGTVTVPIELLSYKYGPAGVAASVYYDTDILKVKSMKAADGFLLTSNGDKFVVATDDGSNVELDGAIAGYVTFEVLASGVANVTFAQDDAAYRFEVVDGNPRSLPTMARFADVSVSVDPVYGDVNSDGIINVGDAVMLLQYLAGNVNLNAGQLLAADVTKDGVIDTADVIVIMQMCL